MTPIWTWAMTATWMPLTNLFNDQNSMNNKNNLKLQRKTKLHLKVTEATSTKRLNLKNRIMTINNNSSSKPLTPIKRTLPHKTCFKCKSKWIKFPWKHPKSIKNLSFRFLKNPKSYLSRKNPKSSSQKITTRINDPLQWIPEKTVNLLRTEWTAPIRRLKSFNTTKWAIPRWIILKKVFKKWLKVFKAWREPNRIKWFKQN